MNSKFPYLFQNILKAIPLLHAILKIGEASRPFLSDYALKPPAHLSECREGGGGEGWLIIAIQAHATQPATNPLPSNEYIASEKLQSPYLAIHLSCLSTFSEF